MLNEANVQMCFNVPIRLKAPDTRECVGLVYSLSRSRFWVLGSVSVGQVMHEWFFRMPFTIDVVYSAHQTAGARYTCQCAGLVYFLSCYVLGSGLCLWGRLCANLLSLWTSSGCPSDCSCQAHLYLAHVWCSALSGQCVMLILRSA